jgi:hypothetical protein
MKNLTLAMVLIFCTQVWAQDEDERVFAVSCSLYVVTMPYTPDSGDVSGKAIVYATLCDKSGIPIPGQKIKMTATCGTLSCPSMGIYESAVSTSPENACFITGSNGKIEVFLSGIPFNRPGRIKASCTYSDIKVSASSSFSITKKIIKKGNHRKSSSRTKAPSVQ